MAGFIEAFLSKSIDYDEEICSLEDLANRESFWNSYGIYMSIFGLINYYFLSWKQRGTFVSLGSMRESLGIESIVNSAKAHENLTLFDFVKYLEYQINVLTIIRGDSSDGLVKASFTNINRCLNKINYYIPNIDETDAFYRLMARNETLEKAIETTDEEDLALLLFDYSHFDSRGDLGEKATILSSIWKFYEINKDSIKKQFPSLSNSIGKIANRCDIRHSLSSSDKAFLRHCL